MRYSIKKIRADCQLQFSNGYASLFCSIHSFFLFVFVFVIRSFYEYLQQWRHRHVHISWELNSFGYTGSTTLTVCVREREREREHTLRATAKYAIGQYKRMDATIIVVAMFVLISSTAYALQPNKHRQKKIIHSTLSCSACFCTAGCQKQTIKHSQERTTFPSDGLI